MTLPLSMLAAHFVGDFVLQSDEMAIGKSKSFHVLTLHCFVYSLCFIFWGWKFFVVTFVTHYITDAVTSRITSRLWFFKPYGESNMWRYVEGRRHWFFVMVGLDQLIHFTTLTWTFQLLS